MLRKGARGKQGTLEQDWQWHPLSKVYLIFKFTWGSTLLYFVSGNSICGMSGSITSSSTR